MPNHLPLPSTLRRMQALAEFRFALRRFLHFSEEAATRAGLPPQQHQLLLQIAGAPPGTTTSIAYLADRLGLRHHSAVELSTRCEEAGLLRRRSAPQDRRLVLLEVTARGMEVLGALSDDHARELDELGPELIAALERVRRRTLVPLASGVAETPEADTPARPREHSSSRAVVAARQKVTR